jgi:hypothetical protein
MGLVEPCPGAACSLWDERASACVLDALDPEVRRRPDLAEYVLELRASLDAAKGRP